MNKARSSGPQRIAFNQSSCSEVVMDSKAFALTRKTHGLEAGNASPISQVPDETKQPQAARTDLHLQERKSTSNELPEWLLAFVVEVSK